MRILRLVGIAVLALTLSGCTPHVEVIVITPGGPTRTSTPGAPPRSAAVVHPTSARTPRTSGPGCSPTGATTPRGAASARIADVDGDGRRDVEWATIAKAGTMRFGVTTASGATVWVDEESASGGDRSVSIGRLERGQVVALSSDGRRVLLHTFVGCRFVETQGTAGRPFEFSFGYDDTDGAGAGCIDGRLSAFHHLSRGHRVTVTATPVAISADGERAHAGTARVVLEGVADDSPLLGRYGRYSGNSCAPSARLVARFHR